MAGTFTQRRKGTVNQARVPSTLVYVNSGGGVKQVFLPMGRDLDVCTGLVTNTGYNDAQTYATFPSPVQTTTSWRSGGKWDSKEPDRDHYVSDLYEISKADDHDRGHEFNSIKQQLISFDTGKTLNLKMAGTGTSETTVYTGEVAFRGFWAGYQPSNSNYFESNGKLIFPVVPNVSPVYGTKLIAQANPAKPNASLMTALLELRDGLPKFPGIAIGATMNKKELLRSSSDEFLNYVFGITPTVKDMKDFLKSILRVNSIVTQYTRDADKIVRRRRGLPPILSNGQESWPNYGRNNRMIWYPHSVMSNYTNYSGASAVSGRGDVDVLWSKRDAIWFSGAFRYHLPLGTDVLSNMDRLSIVMNKLFGSNLDASSIWAALPWSWLVDWFVDIGDIIRNGTAMSQYQGLMQYGYLMCESSYSHLYTVRDVRFPGGYVTDLSTSLVTHRKQRVKATPFGFGLNPNTFSDQQWAILGALGISKGPKSLW